MQQAAVRDHRRSILSIYVIDLHLQEHLCTGLLVQLLRRSQAQYVHVLIIALFHTTSSLALEIVCDAIRF
jgi:hypothetical protein